MESRCFGILTAALLLGEKAWTEPDIDLHGCVGGVGDVIGGSRNAMPDQGGSADRLNQTRASSWPTEYPVTPVPSAATTIHPVTSFAEPIKSCVEPEDILQTR